MRNRSLAAVWVAASLFGQPGQAAVRGPSASPISQPSETARHAASEPDPNKRYSLRISYQDAKEVLWRFGREAGVQMSFLPWTPSQLISLDFKNQAFEKALRQILLACDLDYRVIDGVYQIGLSVDLNLRFPQEGETTLDAAYRCRRVSASSMADAISKVLPDVKVTFGPTYLTPAMDGSGGTGAGDEQLKVLGATDASMKTHDVVFSGPAAMVRRALTLAQKFDRPRDQVRIAVKILRMGEEDARQLGIKWMDSLAYTSNEVGSAADNNQVPGIKLGKFTHAPLAVSATLSALESKGKAKVLSNPTITLLDGERSFVLSGSRFLYPKFTGKDSTGQAMYDVGEAKLGVYLQVGVQVGLDRDMVLTLYPQVTQKGALLPANGGLYPEILTEEIQTTVRAVSGDVLVLGGLIQESTSKDISGMPWLSRIPLLGRLFGTHSSSRNRTELMIILTPELVWETRPTTEINLEVHDPA